LIFGVLSTTIRTAGKQDTIATHFRSGDHSPIKKPEADTHLQVLTVALCGVIAEYAQQCERSAAFPGLGPLIVVERTGIRTAFSAASFSP
jgi:hypothetical protein